MNKKSIPTPHINAKSNEIAKYVLMCGDPNRAKYAAKKYLNNCKLVTSIRGILGFTGNYKNKKVTIIAHGMGVPSIGIYAYELYHFYQVNVIYRIGSAGSYKKDLNIGDIVLVKKAWNDSMVSKWWKIKEDEDHIFYATKKCNDNILKIAAKLKINLTQEFVSSDDCFYKDKSFSIKKIKQKIGNIGACEMEAYALFALAKKFKKKAACLLTISDSLVAKKFMTSFDRVVKFNHMIKLALEAIINE